MKEENLGTGMAYTNKNKFVFEKCKWMIIFIIILFGTFPLFSLTQREKLSIKIIKSYSAKMFKEKGLRMYGWGGSMMYNIENLSIDFMSSQNLEINEARKLYYECVDKFLIMINSDDKIRKYLNVYPFTKENIELNIAFFDDSGKRVSPPYVAYMSTAKENIYFAKYDHDNKNLYNDCIERYLDP